MSIKIEGGGAAENIIKAGISNQLLYNDKEVILKENFLNLVYPVGSIYWSSKNTNPGTLFGGTWTQIKDRFILAAGDSYSNGATGGAATVTLTVSNMPSHKHSFTPSGTVSSHSHTGPSHTHSFTPSGTVASHSHNFTPSGTVSSTFTGNSGSSEETTKEMSGKTSAWWIMSGNKNGRECDNDRIKVEEYESIHSCSWYDHNVAKYTINLSHTHKFIPKGTVSSSFSGTAGTTGDTAPSFSGTAGNTGASGTGNTGETAPSFTGTTGNTSSSGSGSSFSILPPYVVKYCWERTA